MYKVVFSCLFILRRLTVTPGFTFEPRDRSYLPKELPSNVPGTCHFLTGYKHPDVPEESKLDDHIRIGLKDIDLCGDIA